MLAQQQTHSLHLQLKTGVAVQVHYSNTIRASDPLNKTFLHVRLTLTVHYPQPQMVPSEQAAIANIFTQCVAKFSELPLHVCPCFYPPHRTVYLRTMG